MTKYSVRIGYTAKELDEMIRGAGLKPSAEMRACVWDYQKGSILMKRDDKDVDWTRIKEDFEEYDWS